VTPSLKVFVLRLGETLVRPSLDFVYLLVYEYRKQRALRLGLEVYFAVAI